MKKTSADYQREFRRRLREQGLVKKEVWIRPENSGLLLVVERRLRGVIGNQPAHEGALPMSEVSETWTSPSLYEALRLDPLFTGERATIELIEGDGGLALHIVMHEYGDLPIYMSVAGGQIVAESVLWPLSAVRHVAAFNDVVLRTHKYFPLSSIGLEKGADGDHVYLMFGALSAKTDLPNVVFEIEVLASNVIQATEAYREYLSISIEE
jgi:uncharacterized protein